MKVIRPICCGMDVHKDLVVATIATNDNSGITQYLQSKFSTQNFDLLKLKSWLKQHNCFDACMESTGKYWIPIFNILEDEIKLYLTHPKYVKAIKGKKTDKKDSKWIADLFKFDLLKFSLLTPKNIRQLREISRYRIKLVGMRSSERNRYQNSMTVSNIGLASILSDSFGKTATAIMQEILSTHIIDDDSIKKLIHGTCAKKTDAILASLKDSHVESDQRLKMNTAFKHMQELDKHIEELEIEMLKRCAPLLDSFHHITKLPGISMIAAMIIISEIGIDMAQFQSDRQLCCWAGLAPANNESAGKKKSVRISKAGCYLKPLLVQCALAAIRSKEETYFRIKYDRIKKRRGHKKALVAIARMLLVSIYHMIQTGEDFHPSDYDSLKNPNPLKPSLTPEIAIEYLKSLGVDTSSLQLPI